MRRVTVYVPDDRARTLVTLLEQGGYDFMSEDYRDPGIVRRPTPERRDPPPRAEEDTSVSPSVALMRQRKSEEKPKLNAALKPDTAGKWIIWHMKKATTPTVPRDHLIGFGMAAGFEKKALRDALNRLVKAKKKKVEIVGGSFGARHVKLVA